MLRNLNSLPDVVSLDINMPRINGPSVFQIIKSYRELKYIPICLYSTAAEQESRRAWANIFTPDTLYMKKADTFTGIANGIRSILWKFNEGVHGKLQKAM